MPILKDIDQRLVYADLIKSVIPEGAMDFDTLSKLLFELDQKNHPDSSKDRSNGFATTTLLGITRVFQASSDRDIYYGRTETKVGKDDILPISYITHEGVKLISECETPNDFYNNLNTDERTRMKAAIRPGIFNSLSHTLADMLKSS